MYQNCGFCLAEKERFSHKVADDFVCTIATKAFSLPHSSFSRKKLSCCYSNSPTLSATGGVIEFSLSHRKHFSLARITLLHHAKRTPFWVPLRWLMAVILIQAQSIKKGFCFCSSYQRCFSSLHQKSNTLSRRIPIEQYRKNHRPYKSNSTPLQ